MSQKPEMVLFRPKRQSMDFNRKTKLYGKQLYETNSVKYLGIRIDNKLNWKSHIDHTALKLIRANAMLYKVMNFVNAGILKVIHHALFEAHIHILYGNRLYPQSIFIVQKKALRLIQCPYGSSIFQIKNGKTS